jgi:SPP1 family predicted phage head-tail adaptor
VLVQSYTSTQDDTGDAIRSWSNDATIWARVAPVSAKEGFEAEQATHRITHEVTIRANAATITPETRFEYDGRYLYVESIRNPEERGILLTIQCSERTE